MAIDGESRSGLPKAIIPVIENSHIPHRGYVSQLSFKFLCNTTVLVDIEMTMGTIHYGYTENQWDN